MKKKSISDLSDKEFRKETMDNHIWINAFSCIKPTDKFLIGLGKEILNKLEQTELTDSLGISPTILLRINKS